VEEQYVDSERYDVPTHGNHEGSYPVKWSRASSEIPLEVYNWALRRVLHNDPSHDAPITVAYAEWNIVLTKRLPPSISQDKAWCEVRDHILELECSACARMASTVTNVKSLIRYDMCALHHVVVWIVDLDHKGNAFRVFVDVATGDVFGSRPLSTLKITVALTSGCILIIALLAFMGVFSALFR